MKTAVIPQVRVDPGLRAELDFHTRGQAAWENYERSGAAVPADVVLAKLQAKLDARRRQLGG